MNPDAATRNRAFQEETPMSPDTATRDRTFVLTREFNAPRDLVFAAFSKCEHLVHWWGPAGWSLPHCEMDFRVGGTWFYGMHGTGPDGNEMKSYGKASYEAIEAPEKIVYNDIFVDPEGKRIPNTPEMRITVTFEEANGRTRVSSRTLFASKEELAKVKEMGMEQGLNETWDRLEAHLAEIA